MGVAPSRLLVAVSILGDETVRTDVATIHPCIPHLQNLSPCNSLLYALNAAVYRPVCLGLGHATVTVLIFLDKGKETTFSDKRIRSPAFIKQQRNWGYQLSYRIQYKLTQHKRKAPTSTKQENGNLRSFITKEPHSSHTKTILHPSTPSSIEAHELLSSASPTSHPSLFYACPVRGPSTERNWKWFCKC